MNSTWLSPDEVLEDLPSTTRRMNGTLEGHYVCGDAPPPRIFYEDDEMEARFGNGSMDKGTTINNTAMAPDLHGITSMIRMVQDYNSHESDTEEGFNQNYYITISKHSTLNPNVKEFVPRGLDNVAQNTPVKTEHLDEDNSKTKGNAINSLSEDNVLKDDKDIVSKKDFVNENASHKTYAIFTKQVSTKDTIQNKCSGLSSPIDKITTKVNVDVNDVFNKNHIDSKADEPSQTVTSNTKDCEITKLKNKISEASKSDCFEVKKQKNVAIATLLRLYAAKNNVETPEPVKLKTPDYFAPKEKTVEVDSDVRKENKTPIPLVTSPSSSSSTPEPRTSMSPATGLTYTINSHATDSQSLSSPEKPLESSNDVLIKKAIEKVNLWFDPVKRKSPSVFLSPVTFKKREPVKSPVTETTTTSSIEQEVKPVHPQQYRPSTYAADLARKYMDKSKQLNDKKRNIWSNLEHLLKEKDREVKRKREQESSSNNDSDVPQR